MDLDKYKTKKKEKKIKKNVISKSVCEKYKGIIQIIARIILLKKLVFEMYKFQTVPLKTKYLIDKSKVQVKWGLLPQIKKE